MTDALERLRQTVQPIFARYPAIEAVYLFGSTGTPAQRPDSDLDLALIPTAAWRATQKLDILTDLTIAGFDHIDLVVIDGNDLVLQYEAVRQNQLLYHTPNFEPGSFYSKAIRMYLDFLPYLDVQRAAYKRRILDGQT